jgi:glycosyltransferase involved in cell wall biosynthesis
LNTSSNQNNWEIPEHRLIEFKPKRTRYCACIPVVNEGDKIMTQLKTMQPLAKDIDLIIADGDSTDGSLSPAIISELGVRTLMIKKGPGKLSAQLRMGFSYALRQGYEGIVTIDGNNKDDPNAIPLFIKAFDEGYDHIQGSRFIKGGVAVNTPRLRLLGIKLIHAPLISLASGFRYTDTTNGFRGYSRRFLLDPKVSPFRNVFSGYELHYYLAIKAATLGYRVMEVPVTRRYPAAAKIPTKISPIKGNLIIMKTLLKACFHRFDPPTRTDLKSEDHANA